MANKINYKFNIFPISENDGGGFYAEIPELPGCIASADTIDETLSLLEEAMESWIKVSSEKGKAIPQPTPYSFDNMPSGRFSVRTSKSTHKKLIELAESEGESLNGIVVKLLDQSLIAEAIEKILSTKLDAVYDLGSTGVTNFKSDIPVSWSPQKSSTKVAKYEDLQSNKGGSKSA